ncbi:MAG: hypothetical protein ACRDBT_00910, partial [Aeromonas sp.]
DDLQQARELTDTDPTDEQKQSGDYQQGELSAFGLELAIENPKGHVRSGTSQDGNKWQISMAHDYGYIKGTKGLDGDEIDAFIGPNLQGEAAFVISQLDADGKLDEHKVMLGFDDEESAKQGYVSSHMAGWDGLGSIQEMSLPELKEWLPSAGSAEKEVVASQEPDDKANEEVPPVGDIFNENNEKVNELDTEKATKDATFLQSVIDGTVPDMLSPALADDIAAVLERHAEDPAMEALLEGAVTAYQTAMLNATADLK